METLRPTLEGYQKHYTLLRDLAHRSARDSVEVSMPIGMVVSLGHIDHQAINFQQQVWLPNHTLGAPGGFNWEGALRRMRNRIDHFEAAIWAEDATSPSPILCGLAIGKPSKARDNMTITLLEGSPIPHHPLRGRVLPIIIEAAEAYGIALGAAVLRIARPLPSAIPKYQAYGFSLVNRRGEDPYCYRRIV